MGLFKENLSTIITLGTLVGFTLGVSQFVATASELERVKAEAEKKIMLVEQRLDQKIVGDQLFDSKKQRWYLEEKNKAYESLNQWPDERDRAEYKDLQDRIEDLKKKEDELRNKNL